ncbi:ABC transporter ATP-binding protein [Micromonospora sp. NPDC049679]|uniref:ABC transporter ATP-binding protein n=1 Tax=Micromonospora sp. NPDC049679 TaxID=3155920 RepID=UPI0033D4C4D7
MRLDDVWFRYGRRGAWVLREVAVTVEPGQVVVVLGRNGVGKSTLLQLAAGVLRPNRGTFRERPALTGWVPERFPADQPFTVRQYLGAMARLRGLGRAAAFDGWTERLGLTAYRDVKLPALSKGTAQKVGLAQALLRRPGLLILDEPWEGLDAPTRELVPELVREVIAAGGIVLVSDHRAETARLPHAIRWTVADGRVSAATPVGNGDICVVELAVPSASAAGTVAALRAAGHHVLGIRQDAGVRQQEVP